MRDAVVYRARNPAPPKHPLRGDGLRKTDKLDWRTTRRCSHRPSDATEDGFIGLRQSGLWRPAEISVENPDWNHPEREPREREQKERLAEQREIGQAVARDRCDKPHSTI
jgi:hypothetical protein